MRFLLRILINAAALWVAAYFVHGIHAGGAGSILAVAIVFGLVNAIVRPLLKLLSCPIILLTLGLFTLVLNALMLMLTAWVGAQLGIDFKVDDFWAGVPRRAHRLHRLDGPVLARPGQQDRLNATCPPKRSSPAMRVPVLCSLSSSSPAARSSPKRLPGRRLVPRHLRPPPRPASSLPRPSRRSRPFRAPSSRRWTPRTTRTCASRRPRARCGPRSTRRRSPRAIPSR